MGIDCKEGGFGGKAPPREGGRGFRAEAQISLLFQMPASRNAGAGPDTDPEIFPGQRRSKFCFLTRQMLIAKSPAGGVIFGFRLAQSPCLENKPARLSCSPKVLRFRSWGILRRFHYCYKFTCRQGVFSIVCRNAVFDSDPTR